MQPIYKNTRKIDHKATSKLALKHRGNLMLTEIAAEIENPSLSMLYRIERGERKWPTVKDTNGNETSPLFTQFIETINRLRK